MLVSLSLTADDRLIDRDVPAMVARWDLEPELSRSGNRDRIVATVVAGRWHLW